MAILHAFIDESIRTDGWYRLTVVEIAARDTAQVSRALRRIVPRGQYRVHFSSESDARRRTALRSLVDLPITATTFMARTTVAATIRLFAINVFELSLPGLASEFVSWCLTREGPTVIGSTGSCSATRCERPTSESCVGVQVVLAIVNVILIRATCDVVESGVRRDHAIDIGSVCTAAQREVECVCQPPGDGPTKVAAGAFVPGTAPAHVAIRIGPEESRLA